MCQNKNLPVNVGVPFLSFLDEVHEFAFSLVKINVIVKIVLAVEIVICPHILLLIHKALISIHHSKVGSHFSTCLSNSYIYKYILVKLSFLILPALLYLEF